MNIDISLLEICDHDWVNLLKDLRSNEKVKEKKELEQGKDYFEVLLDAGDVVAQLEAQLRQILRKKEWLQASNKVEQHTETDLLHTEHAESSPSLRVELLKVTAASVLW